MSWRRAVPVLGIGIPRGSPGYRTGARLLKILAILAFVDALATLPAAGLLAGQALAAGGPGLSGALWMALRAALAATALVACNRAYVAWVDARTDAPVCAARAASWTLAWCLPFVLFEALPQALGFFPLGLRHLHPLLWVDEAGLFAAGLGTLAVAAAAWLLATVGPRREGEFLDRSRWIPRYVEPRLAAAQWRCTSCGIAYAVPAPEGLCPTCRIARHGPGPVRKNIQ